MYLTALLVLDLLDLTFRSGFANVQQGMAVAVEISGENALQAVKSPCIPLSMLTDL